MKKRNAAVWTSTELPIIIVVLLKIMVTHVFEELCQSLIFSIQIILFFHLNVKVVTAVPFLHSSSKDPDPEKAFFTDPQQQNKRRNINADLTEIRICLIWRYP